MPRQPSGGRPTSATRPPRTRPGAHTFVLVAGARHCRRGPSAGPPISVIVSEQFTTLDPRGCASFLDGGEGAHVDGLSRCAVTFARKRPPPAPPDAADAGPAVPPPRQPRFSMFPLGVTRRRWAGSDATPGYGNVWSTCNLPICLAPVDNWYAIPVGACGGIASDPKGAVTARESTRRPAGAISCSTPLHRPRA